MALTYGFLKCKVTSVPVLRSSRKKNEIQYHLHTDCSAPSDGGTGIWDAAINVGTNDADDLLKYKLAFDYNHPALVTLKQAPARKTPKDFAKGAARREAIRRTEPRGGNPNQFDRDSIQRFDVPRTIGDRINVQRVGAAALISGEPDRSVVAHT